MDSFLPFIDSNLIALLIRFYFLKSVRKEDFFEQSSRLPVILRHFLPFCPAEDGGVLDYEMTMTATQVFPFQLLPCISL